METDESGDETPATALTAGAAVLGLLMALFGVYWDDAWHTDRGRDDLLSAPHVLLYAGVAMAVAMVASWGWRTRDGDRGVWATGPIGTAIVGAAAVLGSAPIDEWWHSAFGRDAVLWSPPHLLAVAGTLALGTGVLLVVTGGLSAPERRTGMVLAVLAGAAVVGGWQLLVLEYDTDVPQFSTLWYLPVLAVGLSASAATVQTALADRMHWPAVWVGMAYTLAMALVLIVLTTMGSSTPIVPAIVPAMIAADLARRRGWAVLQRSFALVAAVVVVYVPYLMLVPGGVVPSPGEVLAGLLLAVAMVAASTTAFDPDAHWTGRGNPAAAAVILVVVGVAAVSYPSSVSAHDPGQGEEQVTVVLMVEAQDRMIEIRAIGVLDRAEPVRVVARRSGRSIEGELVPSGANWAGEVEVDEGGRWFLYVEALRGEDRLEAWIPVIVGTDTHASRRTSLYLVSNDESASSSQIIAGLVLLAMTGMLLGWTAIGVRSVGRTTSGRPLPHST